MSTKLNDSKYCYVSPTILLNISHLFIHTKVIKLFYFNQFSIAISRLFVLSLNVKPFYLTHRTLSGATIPFQTGPENDAFEGLLRNP